jgi:hypothetical protein
MIKSKGFAIMNVATAVQHMTKMYLDRLVGSFSKDVRKFDEDDSRKFVEKNIKEIKDAAFITKKLNFDSYSYTMRLHLRHMLIFLLLQRQHTIVEAGIYDAYVNYLKEQIKKYKNKTLLDAIDRSASNVLNTVFNVAYANNDLSPDEEHVINELRDKVNVTQTEVYALLVSVRPIDKDFAITPKQFEAAIKELQNMGLVYFLNKDIEDRKFVIPAEVATQLAKRLHYPLDNRCFHLLFDDCSKPTLVRLAKYAKLKTNNTKEGLIQKLFEQGRTAEELLNQMTRNELAFLARGVDGMFTSGSKEELAQRLLTYFFLLDPIATKSSALTDVQLWEYFDLMGRRDYATLRQMNVIKKDLEIEHLFEQLTRYAFSKLGNLKLVTFQGNNNPDGGVIGEDGSVLLWDNKSLELAYTFPLLHQRQFLQYVMQAANRNVSSFLVVTGALENTEAVEVGCIKLSGEARVNVGVISATTLKNFFDMYAKTSNGRPLNLQVFNHTGVITNEILGLRYQTFKRS